MGHKLCVSRHVIVLAFTKIDAVGDIFEVHDRKKNVCLWELQYNLERINHRKIALPRH